MLEAIALSVALTGNPDNNGNEGPWYWNGHACTSASDTGMRHGDPIQDREYKTKEQCEWLQSHPQDSPNPVPPSSKPAPSDIPTMSPGPILYPPVPSDTASPAPSDTPSANTPSLPATEAPSWPSTPTRTATDLPATPPALTAPTTPAHVTDAGTAQATSPAVPATLTGITSSTTPTAVPAELAYTGFDWGMLLAGSILVAFGIGTWTLGRRLKH